MSKPTCFHTIIYQKLAANFRPVREKYILHNVIVQCTIGNNIYDDDNYIVHALFQNLHRLPELLMLPLGGT